MKKVHCALLVGGMALLLSGCAKEMVVKDFQKQPKEEVANSELTWFEYSDEQKEELILEKVEKEEIGQYPAKGIVEGIDFLYANTDYSLDDFEEVLAESVESYERVLAFDKENPSENILIEKSIEEKQVVADMQQFMNVFSKAIREKNIEKIYSTMSEASIPDNNLEGSDDGMIMDWEEILKDIEMEEFNTKVIKIMEVPPDEVGDMAFMKVLLDLKTSARNQEASDSYEGLGYIYITKYENEYGFLIKDDIDYLD